MVYARVCTRAAFPKYCIKTTTGEGGRVGWQEGSGLQCIDYTPLFGFTSLFATAGQLDCVWMKSRSVECFIRI